MPSRAGAYDDQIGVHLARLLEGCGGREGRTGRGCEEWRAVVGWSVERGRGGEGDTDTGAERSSACAAKGVGEHFGDLGAWMSREADLEAKDRERSAWGLIFHRRMLETSRISGRDMSEAKCGNAGDLAAFLPTQCHSQCSAHYK